MRKKMIALFLCISTVAALSGCGSSKSSTSTGNADSAEKLVKLGDYKNIEVEVDKSYEISDNSVQETIENYFLTAPIYTENKEKTPLQMVMLQILIMKEPKTERLLTVVPQKVTI